MANSLLNRAGGAQAPPSPPATDPIAGRLPAYGYDAVTGEAKLFELEAGEKLPAGYVDSPAKAKPSSSEDPAWKGAPVKPGQKG